jgi:hypothetical protein
VDLPAAISEQLPVALARLQRHDSFEVGDGLDPEIIREKILWLGGVRDGDFGHQLEFPGHSSGVADLRRFASAVLIVSTWLRAVRIMWIHSSAAVFRPNASGSTSVRIAAWELKIKQVRSPIGRQGAGCGALLDRKRRGSRGGPELWLKAAVLKIRKEKRRSPSSPTHGNPDIHGHLRRRQQPDSPS